MKNRSMAVVGNALGVVVNCVKTVLLDPLLWLLWHLTVLVVKLTSFGAVDLAKAKINSSAVGHIWRLLWPYLISRRRWRIFLPNSLNLPWCAFSGWQARSVRSWLWTPTLLGVSGFFLYRYHPAVALSVLQWILPREPHFALWNYFLGSHFWTAVAACVALHAGLNALAGALIKSICLPTWRWRLVRVELPKTLTCPWFTFAATGPGSAAGTKVGAQDAIGLGADRDFNVVRRSARDKNSTERRFKMGLVNVQFAGRQILCLPLMAQAWLLLGLIGLGCWAVNHYGVEANMLNGKLITAVTKKDAPVFMEVLKEFAVLMGIMTVLGPLYGWVKEIVILCWTKFGTALILDEYADKDGQGYYAISLFKDPDNPNERIQQDLPALFRQVMIFLFGLLDAVITLYLFGQILWGIESGLTFDVSLFDYTVMIEHMMFSALIIYAILGTNGAARVGKKLIGLNAEQRKLGAHFRVLMVMFEKYAEPIAAYRGEEREYEQLWRRFAAALANNYVILRWSMLLGVFTGAYGKVAQFLPLLTLAPFYFTGKIEFGAITQSAGACAEILGALSLIVSRFDSISEMLAYGNRVGELREKLAQIKADRQAVRPRIEREEVEGELLDVRSMDLYLPGGGKLIAKGFNLQMHPGESVLIRGASGSGKTSLLRAIQGLPLWDWGQGKIRIVPHGRRIMLSQLAYLLAEGSLKEQLLYPAAVDVSDEELIAVLDRVNLSELLERLAAAFKGTTANWDSLSQCQRQRLALAASTNWDSLSGGERQRLVVARALVNKVLLVIADECTSGLDQKNEELLYRDMKDAGITILSVGHRASLLPFHKYVVELLNDGKGGWLKMDAGQCQWS